MNAKMLKKQLLTDVKINRLKEKALVFLNKIRELEYQRRIVLATGFIEKERNFGTKKEPIMVNVKYMQYDDHFSDEDTHETITIQRHEMVEIGGIRCDHRGNLIKDLTIYDL